MIKAHPRNSEGYSVLGSLLMRRGRIEEGIAAMSKSLEIEPDNLVNRSAFVYALNSCPNFSQKKIYDERSQNSDLK